jgi:hypothetical protein
MKKTGHVARIWIWEMHTEFFIRITWKSVWRTRRTGKDNIKIERGGRMWKLRVPDEQLSASPSSCRPQVFLPAIKQTRAAAISICNDTRQVIITYLQNYILMSFPSSFVSVHSDSGQLARAPPHKQPAFSSVQFAFQLMQKTLLVNYGFCLFL